MAGESGAIRAGKAFVELSAKDAGLKSALDQAKKDVANVSKAIAMGGAGLLVAGGLLLAPILTSFHEAVDRITAVRKAAEQLNESTESVSALGYAANKMGVDLEGVVKAARHMSIALSEAADGGGAAGGPFAKMGIDAKELMSLPIEEKFKRIADGLTKLSDPEQFAAMKDIFGRGGVDLLPVLRDGAEGLDKIIQKAKEVGAIVSTEDAEKARTYTKAIGQAREAVKYFWEAVGSSLLDAAGGAKIVSDYFVRIVRGAREFVEENRGLVLTIAAVGAALVGAGTAAVTFAGLMVGASATVSAAVHFVNIALAAMHTLLSPVYLIAAGLAAVGAAAFVAGFQLASLADKGRMTGVREVWEELGPVAKYVFNGILDTVNTTWAGIRDALQAGDLKLAFQVGTAGLNVIWKGFLAGLTVAWVEFKRSIVEGWHDIIDEIEARIKSIAGEGEAARQANAAAKAEREKFRHMQVFESAKALLEAKAELDRLVKQAAEGVAQKADKTRKPYDPFAARMADFAQGSFQAVNAGQVFGSRLGVMDKIADNTKRAADDLDDIKGKAGGIPVN